MARVLVIDDPLLIEPIEACLQLEAHVVFAAPTLPEGLRLLEAEQFDLILMDLVSAPDTQAGVDQIQTVQRAAGGSPLVLLSVFPLKPPIDRESLDRYGVADIVGKPFDIDDLLARVRSALVGHQQQLDELRVARELTVGRLCSARARIEETSALLGRGGPPDQGIPP